MRNLKQSKTGNDDSSEIPSSLLSYVSFPKLKKSLFKTVLILVFFVINISGTTSDMTVDRTDLVTGVNGVYGLVEQTPEEIYVSSIRAKFYSKLTIEVDKFLDKTAPRSKLTADYLVGKCLEYDTDIVFVLAQGLIESHYGTKGKASETNSVWNVGTYDDGQILYRYKSANESLEPYLKLINEKYFINVTAEGDTIYKGLDIILQDRGYINHHGKRFASARGYENAIRKLMIKIDVQTEIVFYQEILKLSEDEMLSFFVPAPEGEKLAELF